MDGDSVLTVVFFSVISGLLGYMALTHANELSVVISLLCAFISASTGIWLSRRIHMASLVDKTTSSGKKQHIALKDNRHIAVKSMEIFAQSSLMAVFMVTFALSAIMWTFSTEELSDPNPQTTRFYECQDGEVIWWESAGNGTGCTDGSDLSVSEEEWCGIEDCDNLELRLERYTDRLGDVARNGFPLLLTAAVVPLVGMMYVPLYVLKHNPAMLEHQSLWVRRFANRVIGTGALAFLVQQSWEVGTALDATEPFTFGLEYFRSMLDWVTWMSGGILLFSSIVTWDFYSKYNRRIRFLDHVGKFQWYEFRTSFDGALELVVYEDIMPSIDESPTLEDTNSTDSDEGIVLAHLSTLETMQTELNMIQPSTEEE